VLRSHCSLQFRCADQEVVVARRNNGSGALDEPPGEQVATMFEPVSDPDISNTAEEQQPLAERAAQQTNRARPRGNRRRTSDAAHSSQHDDDEFVDAGAMDNDESDASEMSKERKGDHDLSIEEFDKPVMVQSVEAAAVHAGVPTRKGTHSAHHTSVRHLLRTTRTWCTRFL
jgi:hypothetical protein